MARRVFSAEEALMEVDQQHLSESESDDELDLPVDQGFLEQRDCQLRCSRFVYWPTEGSLCESEKAVQSHVAEGQISLKALSSGR